MAAGTRERVFGTVKVGDHGNATGITLPKDLRDEVANHDQLPSKHGDEAQFVLVENRETGEAELKLVKKEGE